jgi:hypothetical protein
MKIDSPGMRSRESKDFIVRAHGNNALSLNRHRFHDLEIRIDRNDFAVMNNQVGLPGLAGSHRDRTDN